MDLMEVTVWENSSVRRCASFFDYSELVLFEKHFNFSVNEILDCCKKIWYFLLNKL